MMKNAVLYSGIHLIDWLNKRYLLTSLKNTGGVKNKGFFTFNLLYRKIK